MTAININTELQKHLNIVVAQLRADAELQESINCVVTELRTWSGARTIAAAQGIEAGVHVSAYDWGCPLWEYCEKVIGEEALQQGYIHSDDDDFDGEFLLGYGRCSDLLHRYCDLHEHFGAHWLEKTLMAGAATFEEARTLLEKARRSFEVARARQHDSQASRRKIRFA